jgi:hypothetical protein
MSILGTEASLKRATAAYHAAKLTTEEKLLKSGRRGTLCVIERRHTSMRLHPPGRDEWFEYLPAIVRSIGKDGMIREVECGPCRWKHDRVAGFVRSWATYLPGSLIEALGVEGWKSLDEATAAVKAAAGLTA